MTDFDALVNDPVFLPYRGWHGDQPADGPYMPVAQQERDEFIELLRICEERGLTGSCLQLGLGTVGGSHALFQHIFAKVVTIENNAQNVERFLTIVGDAMIIRGSTRNAEVQAEAERLGPFDLCFIDADHYYDSVCADFFDYGTLVRKGGLIALHDAVQRVPGIEVHRFIEERLQGANLHIIGDKLGIALVTA